MKKKQNKKESEFFERCRVIVSKTLGVPPDDIDLCTIMECVKRAIRNSCKDPEGKIVIKATTPKEQKALYGCMKKKKKKEDIEDKLSTCGMKIVNMIFQRKYPFCNWIEYYHEEYGISYIRDKIREDNKFNE